MTRPGTASATCMNSILTRTGMLPVRMARAFTKICRYISSSDATKQQRLTQAVRGEIQLHRNFSSASDCPNVSVSWKVMRTRLGEKWYLMDRSLWYFFFPHMSVFSGGFLAHICIHLHLIKMFGCRLLHPCQYQFVLIFGLSHTSPWSPKTTILCQCACVGPQLCESLH